MRKVLTVTACFLLLAGCAMRDHGAVEYRRADAYGGIPSGNIHGGELTLVNSPPIGIDPIEVRSSITIRLDHGYFNRFPEGMFTPERLFDESGPFIRRGEIAVLVNVREYGTQADAQSTPGGAQTPREMLDAARVIYFSDDIEDRQHANFNNMPIYGPAEYNGRPLRLDIYMVELDTDDRQLTGMLGTLADLGAAVSPTASSQLELLNSIGSSLIERGTDDIFFHYMMVLDPGASSPGHPTARLYPGRYAFIRNDDRDDPMEWDEICVDHNTAKLHMIQDARCSETEYNEQTYITLSITEGEHVADIDLGLVAFSEFRAELERQADADAENLNTALSAITRSYGTARADRNFNRLRNLWSDVEMRTRESARLARSADTGSCREIAPVTQRREATQAASDALIAFHQSLTRLATEHGRATAARAEAGDDNGEELTNPAHILAPEDIAWILREIRRALRRTGAEAADLSLASFAGESGNDDAGRFAAGQFAAFYDDMTQAATATAIELYPDCPQP